MSKKRGKEISLSEKLSSLIQTKPSIIESDEDDLMTVDKIAQNENDSEYSADELDITTFRKRNKKLLEEDDKKYMGRSISRKDLDGSDESEDDASEENQGSIVAGRNSDSESKDDGSDDDEEEKEDDEDDEMDEEQGSEEEIQSSENDGNDDAKPKKSRKGENFNKEIFLKAASDIEKGKAIKNQLLIWDFLLESRMKLQKCLVASNEFPNHRNFKEFKSKGSPGFHESVVECKKSLKHLLNSLLKFQNVLLRSNEEYLSSKTTEVKEAHKIDDDEIFSNSDLNEDIDNNINIRSKKLKSLNDFSNELCKRHADFQTYRNNIIQKWNDKTRIGYISNKNFSAFEQSTLKQIELVLLDKQRLIKRTQTKRSNYHILGETEEEPPNKKPATQSENSLNASSDNKNRGLHKEIFDDDDFYHQLLSEMVKRKSNDVTDPVQLGRQWMQLQKIRSKMKKTVDTKASKGRKIRFVVHPKLVNFMMPIDNTIYNEESRTELLNSLFGKTKK